MVAHRADGGSTLGNLHMSAVAAEPHDLLALLEDLTLLQVVQQLQIAFLMALFNLCHALELGGQGQEALFLGGAGHVGVHLGPLLILTGGGSHQILHGGADPVQGLEPQLGVLLLVQSRLLEDGRDLLVALLLGLAGKIVVLIPGLGLSRKSDPQISLSLASLQFHH